MVERTAVELAAAGIRGIEAGQQVEEGGLPRPVGADQRGDQAALYLEVVHVDGHQTPEAAQHAVGHDHRIRLGNSGEWLHTCEGTLRRFSGHRAPSPSCRRKGPGAGRS